jgi:hypothetical protein
MGWYYPPGTDPINHVLRMRRSSPPPLRVLVEWKDAAGNYRHFTYNLNDRSQVRDAATVIHRALLKACSVTAKRVQ